MEAYARQIRARADAPAAGWKLIDAGARSLPMGDSLNAQVNAMGARPLSGPHEITVHISLASRLLRDGRASDAEPLLRQVLALQPRHADATILLARALMAQNRASDACDVMETYIGSTFRVPGELLLLRAQALLAADRTHDAIPAFHEAIAAAPHSGAAELGLAVAFGRDGRSEAAAAAARSAIAKGADSAGARFVLGRALFESGRFDDAETELRHVLRLQPAHAAAHANLADLVWMRSGDAQVATKELDEALRTTPRLAPLRIIKSRVLDASGDTARAETELDIGLALAPGNVDLLVAAAQIALKRDPRRALAHAEHALQLAPLNPEALGAYADTLLAAGRAENVIAIADKLLQADADDGHAIALRASAWRVLGDPRYRQLYDYARFVRAAPLDTPDGWPDLASYLTDLARSLHRRHSLLAQPINQTLRHGTQVSIHLEYATEPALRAFGQAIGGPVRRYLAALGSGDDPLRSRNTGSCELSEMWSVRLRSGGRHVNHFHGKGWLSSACYIELPETLGQRGGEGWLKFGEPGVPMQPPLPADYFVRPEPGLLVLFPSWMWHGTLPFTSAAGGTRLSIAFDLVPA
jgi:tetratricopeptide (TPR) repeat protein